MALVVVLASPALIIAVPLALLIDDRGWRRWPASLIGGAAAAIVVLLGGWDAYRVTWAHLWNHIRFHRPINWWNLVGLAPLGLTAGIAGGPLLHFLFHTRNEHESTRHHRELSDRRRARTQVERTITRLEWPQPADRTVLGLQVEGSIRGWTIRHRTRVVVAPPAEIWNRQALVLGETGSGKTVTALTLGGELLRMGWDVHWIDGKADPDTRSKFLDNARHVGVDAKDGSIAPIDGWRGGAAAIVNRLLATQVFTEPYYEGFARILLQLAVRDGDVRSLADVVERIDPKLLARAAREDPGASEMLRRMPDKEIYGVRFRYEGIKWAIGGDLDGDWSYENVRASYVPVGRPANRNQASEIGAFLLEDLLHWVMERKPHGRPALVIVDEFSKLSDRPGAAVDLIERARTFGVGVVLVGQSWASLGRNEPTRQRLAGTVGTLIIHQLKQPSDVAALAGTEWTLERTEQTLTLDHTGLGSQRAGNRYLVHPDDVRRLGRGEAFIVNGGHAIRVAARMTNTPIGRTRSSR